MSAQASVEDPADIRPGRLLGRYRILTGIAQGGMARVWAAQQHGQRGFSKIVAIKTILPSLAADPQFETMFLDEARLAAMVHHPNVCEIFDLGEEKTVLYLAMEWINGESLARILKVRNRQTNESVPKRINPRGAAKIIADAASGLHSAHELCDDTGARLDVVHRDVSPQNILVGLDGTVKVTDFGVAKALGNMQEATLAGQVKGKAAYMSPEQARGGRVDRRSDIFALGICLYQATTGVRPFSGTNQLTTLRLVTEGRFDPPSAVVPGYPKELESIVLRAMALDPIRRFPTAERMQHALEEWLARSGPLVTRTQIGTLVRERVGDVVEQRKQRIREARSASSTGYEGPPPSIPDVEPPADGSSSKISAPSESAVSRVALAGATAHAEEPPSIPKPPTPGAAPRAAPGTGKTILLGIGLGLVAFLLIGALSATGYFLMTGPEAETSADAPSPTPTPTNGVAEPVPAVTATSKPADSVPAPEPVQDEVQLIELQLTPDSRVTLTLDGEELPEGTRFIERPEKDVKKQLVVAAPGYESKTIVVDRDAAETMRVALTKAAMVQEPPVPPAAPKPHPASKPPKKPVKADIPDNPF